MAETKTGSGGWGLDAVAARLQAKADEVLHSKSSTTEDGEATTGGKREALLNVANIVKEQAGKGLGSSKEYLTKVVEKVSTYATDVSTNAGTQFADVKERASAHFKTTSESASNQLGTAKETAATHLAGLQTNLNKAIAQGQSQASSTDSGTTDRALPTEEEPLKFPFNVIAWFVGLCHGKGTSAAATTSTTKDLPVESLHNAAATLTDTLSEEAHSAGEQSKAAGEKAEADARTAVESAKSSGSSEVESIKELQG